MNINIPFPFPEEIAMEDILNALGEANQREMAVLFCAITLYGADVLPVVSLKDAKDHKDCDACICVSRCSVCRLATKGNIEFTYAPDAVPTALAALKAQKGQG